MPFDLGYEPSRYRSARPGYNGTSLQAAAKRFPSEDACFDHVTTIRLAEAGSCDKCGKPGRWYRRRGAKYVQHPCGAAFSPLAGTLFHATRLPLQLWFYAMLHFANSTEGVNSGFLARQLGVTHAAAFRMGHRIRSHMAAIEQADAEDMRPDRVHVRLETLLRIRGEKGRPAGANILLTSDDKTVCANVIEKPRRHGFRHALDKRSQAAQVLTTDYRTWRLSSAYGARSPLAAYVPTYFLDNPDDPDLISGFMSYFQWPFQTNHKHCSRKHLWLYLKEFQFRYNRRSRSEDTYRDMVNRFPTVARAKPAARSNPAIGT